MKHTKPILYGTSEKDATILGMFDGDTLLGVGVMSHHEISCKVEYLCIDSALQSCGIGGQLLDQLEEITKQQGVFLYCPHNLEQFTFAGAALFMRYFSRSPNSLRSRSISFTGNRKPSSYPMRKSITCP